MRDTNSLPYMPVLFNQIYYKDEEGNRYNFFTAYFLSIQYW